MKVVSWNVRGMGDLVRRMAIKEVFTENNVQIAFSQVSKLSSLTDSVTREVWGRSHIKCLCVWMQWVL